MRKAPAKKPQKPRVVPTFEAMLKVCALVESGLTVQSACKTPGVPSSAEFYQFLQSSPKLKENYARATAIRADRVFDQMLDIADEAIPSTMNGLDSAAVADKKVRIDARKWVLAKMQPKKYGDSLDLTSGGDALPAIPPTLTVRIVEPDAAR